MRKNVPDSAEELIALARPPFGEGKGKGVGKRRGGKGRRKKGRGMASGGVGEAWEKGCFLALTVNSHP